MRTGMIVVLAWLVVFAPHAALAQDAAQTNGASAETSTPADSQPTQAPTTSAPDNPTRIHVGENGERLVHVARPVYPPEAKAAHVEGTVLLHAIISKDGTIKNVEYVSGPPMLADAAMDAVKQWRYQPTLLNGAPVEVDTKITVVFSLSHAPQGQAPEPGGSSTLTPTGTNTPPESQPAQTPTSSSPENPTRIRLGGNVEAARLIQKVLPVYPPDAVSRHIEGTVILHAIIARDGKVKELHVVSGPPELVGAAMDAVKLWTYKPFLVNGEPVEVDTTVSVEFTLD